MSVKFRAGRELSLTAERAVMMLEHISNGVPVTVAAAAIGASRTSVYRWQKRGLELMDVDRALTEQEQLFVNFAQGIEMARANAVAERIAQVDVAGASGQWQASAWWLERQLPQEFGRTDRHEISGRDGGPIELAQAEIVKQAQQIVHSRMKEIESGES